MTDKIDNAVADDIITRVRSGDEEAKRILVDLVSGSQNYTPLNTHHQFKIVGSFNKEIVGGIDINELVSVFWDGVFTAVDKARTIGSTITDGTKTQCNPLNYIKLYGITQVRKYLNTVYRKGMMNFCDNCNSTVAVKSVEVETKCKCGSSESSALHFRNRYRSKRMRKCSLCGELRNRRFERVCTACQSNNVRLVSRIVEIEKTKLTYNNIDTINDFDTSKHIEELLVSFMNSFPKSGDTKVKTVAKILVGDDISYEVCKLCKKTADDANNQKYCCGSEKIELTRCINFSKRIAAYFGCSATLTVNRVKRVRAYFIKFLSDNVDNDLCYNLKQDLSEYLEGNRCQRHKSQNM